MPHPRTIKSWYAASDLRGDPGLQDATLVRLKIIVEQFKKDNKDKEVICSLVFDEMHIRSQIFWSQQRLDYVGLASKFGNDSSNDNQTIAKQAMVFLLNGINIDFEFPVAYHLIRSAGKELRKDLLLETIKAVTECGVTISVITFDGHPCNIGMCELLGANLSVFSDEFRPFFDHPLNGNKIHIMLDPPHMEKLVRNALGTRGIFVNERNERIEWRFIEKLYQYSKENNLCTHKLSKKHIQWSRNPMNVRIATQTFSESVAKSMQLLLDQHHPDFVGCAATIEFIRKMNTLFDICNTRILNSSDIFKQPLSPQNSRIIFDFFSTCIRYFKNLKIVEKGKFVPILKSARKTAFLGYIIDMQSITLMYKYFVEEIKLLKCLPTYYLSQDVIEMFFGKIRACCGHNNNPNVDQFKGSYRKLQCQLDIEPPQNGNCRILDKNLPDKLSYSNIYFISSRRSTVVETNYEEDYEKQKTAILAAIIRLDTLEACNPFIDVTKSFSVAYIASTIERKIINCSSFYCANCQSLFQDNDKVNLPCMELLEWTPTISTFDICKTAERHFTLIDIQKAKNEFNLRAIFCHIFRSMNFDNLYKKSKFESGECNITHKYQFIKCIVGEYITIRAIYASRDITYDQYNTMFRQQLNRLVLQSGQ